MKINKSVKRNIKCIVLLLIPKETNVSFYNIQSIKQDGSYFTAVTINKLVSWVLLFYISALWIEFLSSTDWLFLVCTSVWVYAGRDVCLLEIVCVCDFSLSCEMCQILWSCRLRRALALCCWPICTVCWLSASSLDYSWSIESSSLQPWLNSDLWHYRCHNIWMAIDSIYLWSFCVA